MTVFADADERDIDRICGNNRIQFGAGLLRIGGAAVDRMERCGRHRQFRHEAGPQIFAESRRVVRRKPDVFVEVENPDFAPVDSRLLQQRRQHFELTGAGSENNVRFAVVGERLADFFRSRFRRRCSE